LQDTFNSKVFAVRIGDRYGKEYEDYLNSKIPNITWIHEPFDNRVLLQWNKLFPMNLGYDKPVVVLDIDIELINDYIEAIEYPIERGEFLTANPWWLSDSPFKIQGGFQKYYPIDCQYIYDKFMKDPEYWQKYYIEKKLTHGPVNGEQYFVYESVLEKLNIKYLPDTWFVKWKKHADKKWAANANANYPGDYLWLGDFNPQVKIVHYLGRHPQKY